MNHFPDNYHDWLCDALELIPGTECDPEVIEPLYRLNQQWVHSDEVMDYDTDAALMRAYTLYYMTINIPKLWHMLEHANPLPVSPGARVVEFGCGPGTFLWSYLFYLRQVNPDGLRSVQRVHGIDRSPAALHYAKRFAAVLTRQPEFSHIEISFELGNWADHLTEPADVAIFGNVLNECEDLSDLTSDLPFGTIAIIEPGTSAVFQKLLSLRRQLVSVGYGIAYPCPTWSNDCPMQGSDNWCHFAINRFTLPFIQRISGKAKRLNPRHNYCGFLYCADSAGAEAPNHWRCVSRLRKAKRSGIRWLCNGCRLEEAVLGRHARSDANRPFMTADYGESIAITPPLKGARLTGDSTVTPAKET